jgi:hypothetical protein
VVATPFSTCTSKPELVFVQLVASIETSDSGSGARPSDHTLSRVRMRGRIPALAKESYNGGAALSAIILKHKSHRMFVGS